MRGTSRLCFGRGTIRVLGSLVGVVGAVGLIAGVAYEINGMTQAGGPSPCR